MKSNDTLLCHLVATDQMTHGNTPVLKVDEVLYNPSQIEVTANEVVYIHYVHSHKPIFNIGFTTATSITTLDQKNTVNNGSNTIIKALGNVKIESNPDSDFFVQLLRIYYSNEES